ncbi:MAG: hypothetical protein U1E17_04120 [Geminicoccaceae bacterium]
MSSTSATGSASISASPSAADPDGRPVELDDSLAHARSIEPAHTASGGATHLTWQA